VRPSVKEQVESLGAKFIDVPYETDEEREAAVGVGGYAKPMPPSWLERQKSEVAKRVAQADIVITTALIPGPRPHAGHRRHGQVHEAGLGDRRHGRTGPGRQLPADRSRPDRRQARRDDGRRDQSARHWWRPTPRRCMPATCSTSSSSSSQGRRAASTDMEDDIVAACLMTRAAKSSASTKERRMMHGHRLSHPHQPDHLRAGHLCGLPRGLDRHARAAHAADGRDQRHLGHRHRRRHAGRRADRNPLGKTMGVLAVALAAVNVFGGFLVTRRMLEMFKKKEKKAPAACKKVEHEHEPRHAAVPGRQRLLHPGAQGPVAPDHLDPRQPVRHGRHGHRRAHHRGADRQAGQARRLGAPPIRHGLGAGRPGGGRRRRRLSWPSASR
jgi:hypothetical protein